ncbi:MAG: hypothetical protein IKK59_03515 [Lachnospiraceae bacterium]|nr:hypothetical protein [Lachnospiraceae bacterium]
MNFLNMQRVKVFVITFAVLAGLFFVLALAGVFGMIADLQLEGFKEEILWYAVMVSGGIATVLCLLISTALFKFSADVMEEINHLNARIAELDREAHYGKRNGLPTVEIPPQKPTVE